MTSKFDHLRALVEQLPQNGEGTTLDWEWHALMRFQADLVKTGVLRNRPPTSNHLRELLRLAMDQPMKAPRAVTARWAKRTAAQLRQEAADVAALPHASVASWNAQADREVA